MQIKFLTINVWFGGIVWDNLIQFIHSQKPDILAIQEVYDGHNGAQEKRFRTMDEFKKEFGDFLPHSTFGATVYDTGYEAPWGNSVFSKFPIKNSKTIFFDLPFTEYSFVTDINPRLAAEGMQEAQIDIYGKDIFVYSWHGVWNDHGGDTPQRAIMQDAIVANLKDKEHVILAGDTNMNPTSNVIQNIQSVLPLQSVFGETLQSTFNMSRKPKPGNYAQSPVDMVFISKNMKVIEKEMPTVDVSDHYPLKVTLEIE